MSYIDQCILFETCHFIFKNHELFFFFFALLANKILVSCLSCSVLDVKSSLASRGR